MASNKKINNSFILAGQVTKNEWVMFFQNIKMILMPILFISLVLFGSLFFYTSDDYDRYLWRKYYQSSVYVDSINRDNDEKTFKREISAFDKIKDNYPKFLLTLDFDNTSINGIQKINVIDWLLG